MSSDNNNITSSNGGHHQSPFSLSSADLYVMLLLLHSSTSFAPETDSANEMSLALTDDTVEETAEELSADANDTVEQLSTDEVAIIFSSLTPKDIMRARVCKAWREAAKKTLVPLTKFVKSVRSYKAMRAIRVMSTALPNLQQLSICGISGIGRKNKYSDGEDPDEENAQRTASHRAHDINIISNFRKLRTMMIKDAPLNGRYPILFNFQLLQKYHEVSLS